MVVETEVITKPSSVDHTRGWALFAIEKMYCTVERLADGKMRRAGTSLVPPTNQEALLAIQLHSGAESPPENALQMINIYDMIKELVGQVEAGIIDVEEAQKSAKGEW